MSFHTRKKRKKDAREEFVEQDSLIFQLPEETLLSIFKNLRTDELIVAGRWLICLYSLNVKL